MLETGEIDAEINPEPAVLIMRIVPLPSGSRLLLESE